MSIQSDRLKIFFLKFCIDYYDNYSGRTCLEHTFILVLLIKNGRKGLNSMVGGTISI